jgi:hypothetical protein
MSVCFLLIFNAVSSLSFFANIDLIEFSNDSRQHIDTVIVNNGLPQFIVKHVQYIDTLSGENMFARYEIYPIGSPTSIQVIIDTPGYSSRYLDVNFDGYKDMILETGSYQLDTYSNVWLYNPMKKLFESSNEFSGFSNLEVDEKNKVLTSGSSFVGGHGFVCTTYVVQNGKLRNVEYEYHSDYTYQKDSLVNNKLITIAKDEVVEDYSNRLFVVSENRYIYGKLRLISKDTYRHYDSQLFDDTKGKNFLDEEPWGTSQYLQGEEYSYEQIKGDSIRVRKIFSRVVNDELKEISRHTTYTR